MVSTNNRNQPPKEVRNSTVLSVLQITFDVVLLFVKIFFAFLEALFRKVFPATEKSVKGEIVLITGTGHGIGKELALLYAAEDAIVVCVDVNDPNNKNTVSQIKKLGKKAFAYKCDLTNRNQTLEIVAKVQREVGEITVLINNVGILYSRALVEYSKEDIERIMNINVMSHFWTLQAVLPSMIKNNRGHIVALSSCVGLSGVTNLIPYVTSKFAVRGMMSCLGEELRQDPKCQIKLTTVYPYMVDTGMCKAVSVHFPYALRPIPINVAAKNIISAQRRNIKEVSIPKGALQGINFLNMLPHKVEYLLKDFLGIRFGSDANM